MRKALLVGVFLALALAATPRANDDGGEGECFTNLANCYQQAALIDSFWWRFAAGLDCELKLVRCAREMLVA
jgi:hypothetical protein